MSLILRKTKRQLAYRYAYTFTFKKVKDYLVSYPYYGEFLIYGRNQPLFYFGCLDELGDKKKLLSNLPESETAVEDLLIELLENEGYTDLSAMPPKRLFKKDFVGSEEVEVIEIVDIEPA